MLPTAGTAREFLAVESYERSITWIGLCLAERIDHAHLRHLVHWDVKPANILLAADGMPLLLDFHLANRPCFEHGGSGADRGHAAVHRARAVRRAVRDRGPAAPNVDARATFTHWRWCCTSHSPASDRRAMARSPLDCGGRIIGSVPG